MAKKPATKPSARAKADKVANEDGVEVTRDEATADDEAPDETIATAGQSYGERIDEILRPVKLVADGLIAEVGEFFLSQKKAAAHLTAWEKLSKEDQQDSIEQSRHQAVKLVSGVVEAIATKGLPAMVASIQNYSGKTGEKTISLKVNVVAHPDNVQRLMSGGGGEVMIVFASPSAFEGAMQTQAQDNQRDMLAEAGGDDDDATQGDDDVEEHDPETGEIAPETPAPIPPPQPIAPETEANAQRRAP